MEQMIVMNATNLGKYIDGIGTYVLNMIKELSGNDDNRRFIVYVNRSSAEHLKNVRLPKRWELRWVSGVVSPDHGFWGHFLRLLYSNYLGLKHWQLPIFAASQLEAILCRKNQIITIHDVIPLMFRKMHRKQYFFFRYVLPIVLRRTRWIITPSHHTEQLLIEKYGLDQSKIRVIYNGVRADVQRDTLRGQEHKESAFILFSGRLVPMKNVAGLLHAFSLIKDKIPHKIVITGHHRKRNRKKVVKDLLGEHGVDGNRVEFRWHVSAGEMENLLEGASLLVFPSFYEGFGLPPLEGMAHGCPVVVSNVSSLPEVCGNAAEYVDPQDAHSIAAGMYKLLTDVDLRTKLIAHGFHRARQFPWRSSAHRHFNVFDEALHVMKSSSAIKGVEWVHLRMNPARPFLGLLLSFLLKFHPK